MNASDKAKWYRMILVGSPGMAQARVDQLAIELRDSDSDLLRGMFMAYSEVLRDQRTLVEVADSGWAEKCRDSAQLSLLSQPEESC
jgi:hypothetical protein